MVLSRRDLDNCSRKDESLPLAHRLWDGLGHALDYLVKKTKGVYAGAQTLGRKVKPVIPKSKREAYYLSAGLSFALLVGGGYVGFQELAERHPQIARKLTSIFRGDSVECEAVEKKELDIRNDQISLEEIIVQAVFTTYNGNSPQGGFIYLTPADTSNVENGEIVFLRRQTSNRVCTVKNSNGIIPTFVGDEGEGGYVTRIELGLPPAEILGKYFEGTFSPELSRFPSLLTLSGELPEEKEREERIEELYSNAARILKDLHVDYVFGPVLDTVRDPQDEKNVMSAQDRSYSSDHDIVIALASMYITAMHGQGIKVIGKHYFGTGYTTTDPHKGLPTLEGITEQERVNATQPFTALASSLDGIMVTHVINPNTGRPDSLSPDAYRTLREQLHFEGIIITDDLYMGAIEDLYERKEDWVVTSAVDALKAGADAVILKYPQGVEGLTAVLIQEMKNDPVFKEQMLRSFARLMHFKGITLTEDEGAGEIVTGKTYEGAPWEMRRVKRGETFLDILAAEETGVAGYNSRGQPAILDDAAFQQLVGQFQIMNKIPPRQMQAGKSYFFPDLTGDGVIAHYSAPSDSPSRNAQPLTSALQSGQNFSWYLAGELGQGILTDEGYLLPVTSGPLQPYWAQFREDNPNVRSSRTLQAGKRYEWRDLNKDGRITFREPSSVQRDYHVRRGTR